MVEFHDDIIRYILLRLPTKPLIRFKCVSKHWCALINSKSFTKQHLKHSIQTKTNHSLILHQHHLFSLYSLGLYPLSHNQPLKLAPPINPNHHVTKILGSCNGLLCLSLDPGNVIIVWNPATHKHVKIPDVKNLFIKAGNYNIDIIHGFWYDSVCDDYRVLKLVQFSELGVFRSEANVYSLRSNSWRKVHDFPNYRVLAKQFMSVLACGALNWLVMTGSFEPMMASFDIVTEECRVFAHPEFARLGAMNLILSELGGCLSIVCNYFEVGIVHMWVMKNYGVTDSWTKLLSVGSEIINPSQFVMPVCYSESGDEVLLMVKFSKLIWYNLEKKTFKFVEVCGLPRPSDPVICLESLVSLGEYAENDMKHGKVNEGAKETRKDKASSWCSKPVDIGMGMKKEKRTVISFEAAILVKQMPI